MVHLHLFFINVAQMGYKVKGLKVFQAANDEQGQMMPQ